MIDPIGGILKTTRPSVWCVGTSVSTILGGGREREKERERERERERNSRDRKRIVLNLLNLDFIFTVTLLGDM